MKKIIVAFFLFAAILQLSQAQNNPVAKKQIPAKKLSVKELNALETEKIKALIAGEKPKKDTLPEINPQSAIVKEVKKDSAKATAKISTEVAVKKSVPVKNNAKIDSVVRKVIPINIAEEKPAEPKPDTLPYRVYTKSERVADSIKNAHKHECFHRHYLLIGITLFMNDENWHHHRRHCFHVCLQQSR